MSNYVHSLCWNFPSEVEKTVDLLYGLNNKKDFKHVIVDLGFPLSTDELPINIRGSIHKNTIKLKDLASRYGSDYIRLDNEGVSQNWTKVYEYFNLDDDDILCCADPDEHPKNKDWVKAIGNVMREDDNYAWVSLTMPEHLSILNKSNTIEHTIGGERVWDIKGSINWAQGGFSGYFLNDMGGVPYLKSHPIYGNIESASLEAMKDLGYKWCMLPDYIVEHTDYEKGSEGTSRLLREWKNFIIFNIERFGQITFEDYLEKLRKGEI
jgi:hypothetical protein